jgi:hypothetical protein
MALAKRRTIVATGPQDTTDPVPEEPQLSSAEITALLEQAQQELIRRQSELARVQAEYADAPSVQMKHAETNALVAADVAATQVSKLKRDLAAAAEREEQERRWAAYAASEPMVDEARALHAEYTELAGRITHIAGRLIALDDEIYEMNHQLPAGAERLSLPCEMRGRRRQPRTKMMTYSGWISADGKPLDPELPTFMQPPRSGPPPQPGATWGSWQIEAPVPFTVEDAQLPSHQEPFDTKLQLPALDIGGTPYWPPRRRWPRKD